MTMLDAYKVVKLEGSPSWVSTIPQPSDFSQTPTGATPPEPRSTPSITMQSDPTGRVFAFSFGHSIHAHHIPAISTCGQTRGRSFIP